MKFSSVLITLLTVGSSNALFNNKKKEEEQAKRQQAADDVQLGFAGIREAASNPAMMQDLMKSLADPDIMAEAQKMMADPAFQTQMKAMMGDQSIQEATARAQEAFAEIAADPAKLELAKERVAKMMAGVDTRADLSEGMRRDARKAAGKQFGIESPEHGIDRKLDGATNAKLGMASIHESMTDPKAMQEAMELMKDPAMMAEVRRMMSDPSFRAQAQEMLNNPQMAEMMKRGAQGFMQDPEAMAKMQRLMGAAA